MHVNGALGNDTFKIISFFACATITIQIHVFFDFSLTVKAVPHECVFRTSQP